MREAILNFHGIGAPHSGVPEDERPYWVTEARFRETLDLAAAAPRPVRITFDDGNASDLEIAAPILAGYDLPAEIYVLTGRLDRAGYLSPEGVRAMEAAGVRVGTHGVDHVNWRDADPATLAREIEESRARLGAILGRPIDAAAIPFGAYGSDTLRALRRAGLARVCTSDGGLARPGAWLQPRLSIRRDTPLEALEALMAGREPWRRRLRRAVGTRLRRGFAA